MKTLIFFGAARKNGHTKSMVNELVEHLEGEAEVIDTYRLQEVSPCKDCRYCWKVKACAIKDGMQEIYEKIEAADCIIMASPMYFHSVTGPFKTVIDRLQVYWAGHGFRKDAPEQNIRKGAILMVGGAPSFEGQFLGGEIVLKNVLKDLSTECLGTVCMPNSDVDSLATRSEIREEIRALAVRLNQKQ